MEYPVSCYPDSGIRSASLKLITESKIQIIDLNMLIVMKSLPLEELSIDRK